MPYESNIESDTLSGMYEPFSERLLKEIADGQHEIKEVSISNISDLAQGVSYVVNGTIPYKTLLGPSYEVQPIHWDSSMHIGNRPSGIPSYIFSYDTRYLVVGRTALDGIDKGKTTLEVYTQDDCNLVKKALEESFADKGIQIGIS